MYQDLGLDAKWLVLINVLDVLRIQMEVKTHGDVPDTATVRGQTQRNLLKS
jgi:hypothetical protein